MNQKSRRTILEIKKHKAQEKALVCLTAYTTPMARILDPFTDLFIVGDSVGMVLYGMENTLEVDFEMMVRHGQAVMRAAPRACVVIDMPFGTYEENPEQAYRNAVRMLGETGCDAVKLEGGREMAPAVEYLTGRNIPVMGHVGLLPQSVVKEGGYKIKGRTRTQANRLLEDAFAIEAAGAFAVVIEGTVPDVAEEITKAISIPTVGIGASPACDGQVLVTEDMLGLLEDPAPKFVREYADLKSEIEKAAASYAADVRARRFPASEHLYAGREPATGEEEKMHGAL